MNKTREELVKEVEEAYVKARTEAWDSRWKAKKFWKEFDRVWKIALKAWEETDKALQEAKEALKKFDKERVNEQD